MARLSKRAGSRAIRFTLVSAISCLYRCADRRELASKINNFQEFTFEATVAAVDDSLAKLGTGEHSTLFWPLILKLIGPPFSDYIDYMLIHSPLSDKTKRIDTWKGLIDAKKQGKLKVIGVAN